MTRAIVVALLASATACSADPMQFPGEGWARWHVRGHSERRFCCLQWTGGSEHPTACELEREWNGPSGKSGGGSEDFVVYAYHYRGVLERLRVYDAACEVRTTEQVKDLDEVSADSSLDWVLDVLDREGALSRKEVAMAVLAIHDGARALAGLTRFAKEGVRELRVSALTWLGLVRGAEGATVIRPLMFHDPLPKIREHAAFALSQTGLSTLEADLTALGTDDPDPKVRGQAWFWMAEQGLSGSEAAFARALRSDPSPQVREGLIFAMSRLPPPRATAALLAQIADRSAPREVRKKALFWLAQSDDARAVEAVSQVLR